MYRVPLYMRYPYIGAPHIYRVTSISIVQRLWRSKDKISNEKSKDKLRPQFMKRLLVVPWYIRYPYKFI